MCIKLLVAVLTTSMWENCLHGLTCIKGDMALQCCGDCLTQLSRGQALYLQKLTPCIPTQTTFHGTQLGSGADLHEGRHGVVDLRRLPDGSLLGLEAEGRKRPVVGAALGDAARKQVRGMRLQRSQQVKDQVPCSCFLQKESHQKGGYLPKCTLSVLL